MGSDNRWYLDTSSVRRLSAKLKQLPHARHVRTSAWTLVELCSGALKNEEEFRRRSAAVRALLEAGTYIIRVLPQIKIAAAFQVRYPGADQRIDELMEIANLTARSASLDDLRNQLESKGLSEVLAELAAWDTYIGELGTGESNRFLKSAFEQDQMNPDSGIPPEHLVSFEAACEYYTRDLSLLVPGEIMIHARQFAMAMREPNIQRAAVQLAQEYDGSMEPFMRARIVEITQVQIHGGSRKRNDISDLSHFVYFTRHTTLVSDDNGMIELASRIGVATMTSDELLGSK